MFTIYKQIRKRKAHRSLGCRGGRRKGSLNHSLGEGFLSLREGFLGGPPSVRIWWDWETETRMYGGWFHRRLGFTLRAILTRLHLRWCTWKGHKQGLYLYINYLQCLYIISKYLNSSKKDINLQNWTWFNRPWQNKPYLSRSAWLLLPWRTLIPP